MKERNLNPHDLSQVAQKMLELRRRKLKIKRAKDINPYDLGEVSNQRRIIELKRERKF